MYTFLKQNYTPKEDFTKEQMYALKEIHEEVDMFMEQFHAKYKNKIRIDDIKGDIPPKRASMVKKRIVYGMNNSMVEHYKREVMRYNSRVLQITQGRYVASISNKLINPVSGASFFMIKRLEGNQSRKISLARLEKRKQHIKELFQKTFMDSSEMVEYLEEDMIISKAIEHIVRNNKKSITLRTPVNDIRFFAYDNRKRIVTPPQGEHFKGGILINTDAKEVEIFSSFRKERITKIQEYEKLYIDNYSYFVCKGR